MKQKTKTYLQSSFFIFIIIIFTIGFGSISVSSSDKLENPNGEGNWEFEDTSINTVYHNENGDADYIIYNSSISGNTISTTVIEETESTVTVNLNIELTDYAHSRKDIADIDYNELLFEIDKEDNDATLIEEGHPMEGTRIGFFPFFGFAEEPVYDNTYDYILGGESEPVRFVDHIGIEVVDSNQSKQSDHYTIESVYKIEIHAEDKVLEYADPSYVDEDIFELGEHLDIRLKQYQGRLYPFSVSVRLPAEILIEEPEDEAFVSLWPGFSSEQKEVIEFIQALPPMEDPHDLDYLRQILLFFGVPGAIATYGGYMAYKKKEGV